MIRTGLSCLLGLTSLGLTGLSDFAYAQETGLTSKLDAFVESAVQEGLLQPARDRSQTPTPTETNAALEEPYRTECVEADLLDFTAVANLLTYEDLLTYREGVQKQENLLALDKQLELSRAYLGAGLTTEARAFLGSDDAVEKRTLRDIALIFDGRSPGPDSALAPNPICGNEDWLWTAVYLTVNEQERGPDGLRYNLTEFRKLPMRMKAALAARLIPALIEMDEDQLALRIMSDFEQADIERSSLLAFAQAVLDHETGNSGSVTTLQDHLKRPTTQATALTVLEGSEALPVWMTADMTVRDAVTFLARASSKRDEATRLRMVVDTFAQSGRFDSIEALARSAAFQSPTQIDYLKSQIRSRLEQDLTSNQNERAFAAIDYLLSPDTLLSEDADHESLILLALNFAEQSRLSALAAKLETHLNREGLSSLQASLQAGDFKRVYKLADEAEWPAEWWALAAKAALAERNREMYAHFEVRLLGAPDKLLPLLEEDAVLNLGFASADAYAVIAGPEAGLDLERVNRLIRLRGSRTSEPQSSVLTLAEKVSALSANRSGQTSSPGGRR